MLYVILEYTSTRQYSLGIYSLLWFIFIIIIVYEFSPDDGNVVFEKYEFTTFSTF